LLLAFLYAKSAPRYTAKGALGEELFGNKKAGEPT